MPRRTAMGLTPDSFPARRIQTAHELVELSGQLGAGGCQVRLSSLEPEYARKLRARAETLGLYLTVSCGLPGGDAALFESTVRMAREAGAIALRVPSGGRRYEDFATLAERQAHVSRVKEQIRRAVPIAEKARIPLGIENHKDWAADEHVALLKEYSSEYLGACVDTGNNIALLEDPMETVQALAPFAVTSHLKDMAVEEYPEGFLLAEVPLGEGFLDLPKILATLRARRPGIHFSLEMITRDPLRIPCLTQKYWTTFPEMNGWRLARALAMVRANKPRQPLPRVSGLDREAALRLEMDHVERSIAYASRRLGLV